MTCRWSSARCSRRTSHIRVQRWGLRRVLLALATSTGVVISVALVALNLRVGGLL